MKTTEKNNDNVNTVNTWIPFFHDFFWQPESGEKVDARFASASKKRAFLDFPDGAV